MKISKLYSNEPLLFKEIKFNAGLNVILGEIRLEENQDKDTHNLGKTTVGRLIDFCLLSKRSKSFFLFKHIELFESFVFLLEIKLLDGSFLTLRRGVRSPSKISFKKHSSQYNDYSELDDEYWDHLNLPFEKAKHLLDGVLDLQALAPWGFRKFLGYLLRTQADYNDIFQLKKFVGKHVDWKPFIAHILGFDGNKIENHYQKKVELEKIKHEQVRLLYELGEDFYSVSKIDGLLLLKEAELDEKQSLLEQFDFKESDREATSKLVGDIENGIAELNSERYRKTASLQKIVKSLDDDRIVFDPEEAAMIFSESGIHFAGQIKKNYQQLIEFNKAITDERHELLLAEKEELEGEILIINNEIDKLYSNRNQVLKFLKETNLINKFKKINKDLVSLGADIELLKRHRETALRVSEIEGSVKAVSDAILALEAEIKDDVQSNSSDKGSLFSKIRIYFNSIVENVISRKAVLSTPLNSEGHIEFNVDILDSKGKATSAASGNTYKKLLCIAFDMAILRAYSEVKFPRFIFHDGIFESLDDRKKMLLIANIREYSAYGIQHIVTLIDSELPESKGNKFNFTENEIILKLHDEGDDGQLFMMPPW